MPCTRKRNCSWLCLRAAWPARRLPKVATEMALSVLAYNLTRVMNILGVKPLMAAIRRSTEQWVTCWPAS